MTATATDAVPRWPVTRCSSTTCGRPVIWAYSTNNKPMPVDAEPSPFGSIELVDGGEAVPRGQVVAKDQRAGRGDLHTSHFATCPAADRFRGPR